MRKLIILFLILVSLGGIGSSQVFYEIDGGGDEAIVNTSAILECTDCPVTLWEIRLRVPDKASIQEVKSQNGEVRSFSHQKGELAIKTETPPSKSEKVRVIYEIDTRPNKISEGLNYRSLSLAGFPNKDNKGTASFDNLLNGKIGGGFKYSIEGEQFNFSGKGPTNLVAVFGNGEEKEQFEFFGGSIKNSSLAYRIAAGTLGVQNQYKRFPTVLWSSEKYDSRLNEWSAGQYVNATIIIRKDLEEEKTPVLAHEVVHGLNQQNLNWDAESSWFDEGMARYVEFATRKSLGQNTREVFGDETKYTKENDGKLYRYTLFSKGDKQALWKYYNEDQEWMKNWKPERGNREFGYAYSELVFRNYVAKNGSIKELYKKIDNTKVRSNTEKWKKMSRHMDLTPCKTESREEFNNCIEQVNSFDYPIYAVEQSEKNQETLRVSEIDVPKPPDNDEPSMLNPKTKKLIDNLVEWAKMIIGDIK